MTQTTKGGEIKLFKLMGLEITATPLAIIGTVVLWIVLSALGYWLLQIPLGNAVVGGLAATLLYQFSDLWHQLGHAVAARGTGHPMSGVRFGFMGILSTDLYPSDEGELAPAVHLRRAWGGPIGSFVLSIIALIIFLLINTGRTGGTLWWLAIFFLAVNFLLFTLEAFIPLGFNDGSSIRHWRQAQQKQS